jgi:hypothetical protein
MIHDLDDTLKALLQTYAPGNSLLASATISFDLPDLDWRNQQQQLTLNCYLYDVRQNMTLRTDETLVVRSADDTRATRIRPPVRIDCAYCITAWSAAQTPLIAEEHRLLGDVLRLLIRFPTIPAAVLQGSLVGQFGPYPGLVAAQDGVKNQPDFWSALDQRLKPSLNYIITLAMLPDEIPNDADLPPTAGQTVIDVGQK